MPDPEVINQTSAIAKSAGGGGLGAAIVIGIKETCSFIMRRKTNNGNGKSKYVTEEGVRLLLADQKNICLREIQQQLNDFRKETNDGIKGVHTRFDELLLRMRP